MPDDGPGYAEGFIARVGSLLANDGTDKVDRHIAAMRATVDFFEDGNVPDYNYAAAYHAILVRVREIFDGEEEPKGRPKFTTVPCGRTLGHGESCCDGNLCGECSEILRLRGMR